MEVLGVSVEVFLFRSIAGCLALSVKRAKTPWTRSLDLVLFARSLCILALIIRRTIECNELAMSY